MTRLLAFLALLAGTASGATAQRADARADTLRTNGLQQPVEVLRDRWGVNHIYAKSEHDLFFAQGYLAAKDRTFQFELWRRQATGTLAELLGEREVQRDVGVRLFKYRGDKTAELTRYHPRGPAIVDAFVDGVNAFVAATRRDTTLIPLELRMLGARPQPWTWEVVVSRHGGLLGNVTDELSNGRFVAAHGAALLKKLTWYHPGPGEPVVTLDSAVDGAALAAPILDVFNAFRGAVRFRREDLQVAYRGDSAAAARLGLTAPSSMPIAATSNTNGTIASVATTRSTTVRSPPMSFQGAVAIHAMLAVSTATSTAPVATASAFCTNSWRRLIGSAAMKSMVPAASSPASAPVPAITAYTAMIEGPSEKNSMSKKTRGSPMLPEPAPNASRISGG